MGLSRNALATMSWLAASWWLASCSVGHGEGEVEGTVAIAGCRDEGPYQLRPTVFLAEAAEQSLQIRIQRGGDLQIYSDGLSVVVDDTSLVREQYLGQEIPVGDQLLPDGGQDRDVAQLDLTLYLNESCPAERTKTPVALSAVSGTVRFDSIYAPKVDKHDVRIIAALTNVRFEDPRVDDRWALLDGKFDFLYVRGSPAQTFP